MRVMESDGIKNPILSLCMPTNGVSEWVFPSLDSIYCQGIDEKLYEVIIMDNGLQEYFKEEVKIYAGKHTNLKYYQTDKPLFLSEPESYKCASGELIKFVNHRNIMEQGSIQRLLDFAINNRDKKPVIYYSNGSTKRGSEVCSYSNFGEFVEALGYYSTWSSGMTVWKTDMDSIPANEDYNYLFPHTNILFHRRDAQEYIIDGTKMWKELSPGRKPKGDYNVFYAFAVEYLYILLGLLRDGDISKEQFLSIKKENKNFLTNLYRNFIIKKDYCSYDLSDYKKSLNVFYSVSQVYMNLFPLIGHYVVQKVRGRLH